MFKAGLGIGGVDLDLLGTILGGGVGEVGSLGQWGSLCWGQGSGLWIGSGVLDLLGTVFGVGEGEVGGFG